MQTEKKTTNTTASTKRAAQQIDKQLYSEYLSFQYDKEDDEDYTASYRPKVRSKKYTRQQIQQRKGLYMRAKFRFITTQDQVIFPCVQGEVACPICMNDQFEIVAPQITPCGHIYCWTCYLRHQDISDTKNFCPLCGEFAHDTELKSARIQLRENTTEAATTEFQLLFRQDAEQTLYNAETQVEDPRFSKIVIAKYDYVLTQIYQQEQQSLNDFLDECVSANEMWNVPYIEDALKLNEKKMEKMRKLNEAEEIRLLDEAKKKMKKQLSRKVSKESESSASQTTVQEDNNYYLKRYKPQVVPTGNALSHNSTNKKTDLNYFYQEASGSLIFLNPVNLKYLMLEKKGQLPPTIKSKVQGTTNVCADENLKRRNAYLRHIPEYSDITFAEIDMEGLISQEGLQKNNAELAVIHKKLKDKEERENKRMAAAAKKDHNNPYGEFFDREYYIINGLMPLTPQTLPTEEKHYPQLMTSTSTSSNNNADAQQNEVQKDKQKDGNDQGDDDYVIVSRNGQLPKDYFSKTQRVNESSFPSLGTSNKSAVSGGEGEVRKASEDIHSMNGGSPFVEEQKEMGQKSHHDGETKDIVDLGNNVIVDGDYIYDEWNQATLLQNAKSMSSSSSNSNSSNSNGNTKKKGKKVVLPGNFFY